MTLGYWPRIFLCCTFFSLISLACTCDWSVQVLNAPYDCLRYIEMAFSLMQGKWLGNFDLLTLIRLPVYPFFLVLNAFFGLPLHVFQQVLYLISIFLLILALGLFNISSSRLIILFLLCSLHPMALFLPLFVATEALYV